MQIIEKNLENISKDNEKIVKKRKRKKWKAEETDFSKLLKKIRTKHIGFTQQLVATYAGVPRCRISEWESGSRVPSKINLDKLIKYYYDRDVIDFSVERNLRQLHRTAVLEKRLKNFPCMDGVIQKHAWETRN